jgi:hypothetical protein
VFQVWRYHRFFTNTELPVEQSDITHRPARRHKLQQWLAGAGRAPVVFAGLIGGALAHLLSGRFGANSAWILCGAIAHNLLRHRPCLKVWLTLWHNTIG